jgi:predicted AlkP superfamily pyrophosphatase or phosphodiesterase
LLGEGFSFDNAMIPYTPTYTAAGHSSIYTGSVPALNGIIGNSWYSRELKKVVYCTDDSTARSVGSSSNAGWMSPRNMWANTISDEMRMATNFRSKTIGIALKDRGSILPAGHSANAAYWFDNASGGWITSTYYMNDLPAWMKSFNDKKLPDQYMSKDWTTLYPLNTYVQSSPDDKAYESPLAGENKFPHTVSKAKDKYGVFRVTPYANTYTIETAKAAIEGEQLGADEFTDMLTVSFSTPDYIGHSFGPNSIEIEDTYLRLDKDLENFLQYLDKKVGKGQYLVFLTADHGAAQIPGFLNENKMPGGTLDDATIQKQLNASIGNRFGIANAITQVINYQVYLNKEALGDKQLQVENFIVEQLLTYPEISHAFPLKNLPMVPAPENVVQRLRLGYNQKLSGDIQFLFKPGYFDGWKTGTTHGSWNPYDSHIPMIYFGWGIKHGHSNKEVYMTDIAPTLAALLRIQMPNASIGEPLF